MQGIQIPSFSECLTVSAPEYQPLSLSKLDTQRQMLLLEKLPE